MILAVDRKSTALERMTERYEDQRARAESQAATLLRAALRRITELEAELEKAKG